MTVESFINAKARQLAYFVRAFWAKRIPYAELDLYFWDTMEEWLYFAASDNEPYSQKERAFWHLLHQLHFWPEQKLMQDPYLRSEIDACLNCLEDHGYCPIDCIGIRP